MGNLKGKTLKVFNLKPRSLRVGNLKAGNVKAGNLKAATSLFWSIWDLLALERL